MFHPERPPSHKGAAETENAEKELRFQSTLRELEKCADACGLPVDRKIVKTVAILNLLGIPTVASCEGHIDHGNHAPWVDIAASEEPEKYVNEKKIYQKVADKYGVSYEDAKRALHYDAWVEASGEACRNNETPEHKKWRAANQALADKVEDFLEQFYKHRLVAADARIILSWHTWGIATMHNGGEDYRSNQEEMNDQERSKLLDRLQFYQSEMDAFTEFLKHRYLQ